MLCGASLPWRLAAACYITTSVLSLVMILLCRESPSWLLRKGREDDALDSLFFYRGDMDTSKQELQRIKKNLEVTGSNLDRTRTEKLKSTLSRLASPQFPKPFLFLNLILN